MMEFNGQTMANCLYGMRRMSLDHAEIREFAQILIAKFDKTSLLTPAQVYNAMHFLPNMTRYLTHSLTHSITHSLVY